MSPQMTALAASARPFQGNHIDSELAKLPEIRRRIRCGDDVVVASDESRNIGERGCSRNRRTAKHDADQSSAEARQSRRLVIFFHGIRGRGSVMNAIGDSWKATLPDTEFVSPDAPFAHRSGGRQWFTVDEQVLRPDRIAAARRAFDDLVADIVRQEGFQDELQNVAFVGVSQGAIMALDAVASGRWKVGALVSFAGLLPLPPVTSSSETSVLLMHGGADGTIPPSASVAAEAQLKAAGYDVTYELSPAVGHTISAEQARQAASFLRERFAG